MGRPLHKKYFGNRNIGTTGTSDNGIGGQGVASAAVTVAGSYTTLRPAFTFTAPDLAGGVTATGTITSEVLSATISGGANYGNAQTFNLTVANAAGETAVLNVTSEADGTVITVNSITTRGTFTALTAVVAVSGGTGTGAVPVLTYRAKTVVITEKGSGYATAPTIAGYTNRGGITVATVALTTDTGNVGSSTNQENSIAAYAYVTGNSLIADIIKQEGSRMYKVKTSEGTLVCKLVTDGAANAVGEMTIVATDSSSKTYYVKKLTSRKAVLIPFGTAGHEFTTGSSVKWTFGSAVLNSSVTIANN